jgi:hypothetical protein
VCCWQRADRSVEIDIHPRQAQRLELALGQIQCEAGLPAPSTDPSELFTTFAIPSEAGYPLARFRFRGKGFQFLVRVGADNAEPVHQWGQILAALPAQPSVELSDAEPTNPFPDDPEPLALLRRRQLEPPGDVAT